MNRNLVAFNCILPRYQAENITDTIVWLCVTYVTDTKTYRFWGESLIATSTGMVSYVLKDLLIWIQIDFWEILFGFKLTAMEDVWPRNGISPDACEAKVHTTVTSANVRTLYNNSLPDADFNVHYSQTASVSLGIPRPISHYKHSESGHDLTGVCNKQLDTTVEEIKKYKHNNLLTLLKSSYCLQNLTDVLFLQDEDGDTFLHMAIIHDKVNVSIAIIKTVTNSFDLDIPNRLGQTALHLSVLLNRPSLTRLLVCSGANVSLQNIHGDTALHVASARGYTSCMISLLTPPKHQEVLHCRYPLPFHVIPQRQDIRNYEGLTCVHLAALGSHYQALALLVNRGAVDINVCDGTTGSNVLHYAAAAGNYGLTQYLLRHYASLLHFDAVTYDDRTPLSLAVDNEHRDVAHLLWVCAGGAGETPQSVGSDSHYLLNRFLSMSLSRDEDDTVSDSSYDDFRIGSRPVQK